MSFSDIPLIETYVKILITVNCKVRKYNNGNYYWPTTHSVGRALLFCSLASVVVCNMAHMQRTCNSPGAARDGGPVVLRPVRATPCFKSDK